METTARLTTESLHGDRVVLRTIHEFDRDFDQFHPPPPAEAIADSAAARQHLDHLIDEVRPFLPLEKHNALVDAAVNLEVTLRREFFSRLVALAVDALDQWPVPSERIRPAVIVVRWVQEDADATSSR